MPRLLAAADIHCQPNLGPEPFGISYVEALHSGLPCRSARDMGGAAEIVTDDWRAWRAAVAGDPEGRLASALGARRPGARLARPASDKGRFDPDEALAAALARLIDEPEARSRLAEGGPNRARGLCDPEVILGRLHDLLATLVPSSLSHFSDAPLPASPEPQIGILP